jgi:hypothetical protein
MNACVYATFEELKQYFANSDGRDLTVDDNILKAFCVKASRKLDMAARRRFFPIFETVTYNQPFNVKCLEIDEDLLKVFSVITNNGDTTLDSSVYYLACGDNTNLQPYDRIRILSDEGDTFTHSGTIEKANTISGLFGYHEDFANAWADLDTVQDDPLTALSTTLTVTDVDGLDEYGIDVKFKIQQLIRLGEDGDTPAEMCYITSLNAQTNTLTVIRGVNGTEAVEHLQGTKVYIYRPQPEIVEALQILATHSYRRKNSVGNVDDRAMASQTGILLLPSKLPGEVQELLDAYTKWPKHNKPNTPAQVEALWLSSLT